MKIQHISIAILTGAAVFLTSPPASAAEYGQATGAGTVVFRAPLARAPRRE